MLLGVITVGPVPSLLCSHQVSEPVACLAPCLACTCASLSLKFQTFTQISRCLSFLIICSQNLLSLFHLLPEVILPLGQASSMISSLLSSSARIEVSWIRAPHLFFHLLLFHISMGCCKGWCPEEFAKGYSRHLVRPSQFFMALSGKPLQFSLTAFCGGAERS